jgi:type II secretory pathway pseudopilin PulG
MKLRCIQTQHGLSLISLIFVMAIVGLIAVLGLKVVPTFTEYLSIKKLIVSAKGFGTSAREIQIAFDKGASVAYVESISGKDLEFSKNNNEIEVSFAYQKKIPLVGPVSLLIDYEGSTAKNSSPKKTIE